MTPTEAAALLTICSGLDNRKPTAETAQLWAEILGDLPLADCRAAVVAHYRESREWLMPSDIHSRVKGEQRARLAEFYRRTYPTPPLEVRDDPVKAIEWSRDLRRRVKAGEVDAETWLAGHPDDKRVLAQRSPREDETPPEGRDDFDDDAAGRRLFDELRARRMTPDRNPETPTPATEESA